MADDLTLKRGETEERQTILSLSPEEAERLAEVLEPYISRLIGLRSRERRYGG